MACPLRYCPQCYDTAYEMIQKTEAIVLRIFPFSRTSHMVSWLTRDGDRITTSVKGATRSKSPFLGQYDLFYTCELLYYTRERNGVHIAKECTPLAMREKLRANWRSEQCASWFSALAYNASGGGVRDRALYSLFSETLDFISALDFAPPAIVFARYEAKILSLMGLAPNFGPCRHCEPSVTDDAFLFNLASGSRHCPAHSTRDHYDPMINVSRRTVALFNEVVASHSLGLSSPIARIAEPRVFALLRLLGLFIRYHLENVPFEGRAIALKALLGV